MYILAILPIKKKKKVIQIVDVMRKLTFYLQVLKNGMRTTSAKSVHKPLVVILIYTSTELKYELTYHACNRAHLHSKDTIKKSNIIFTSDVSGILA